MSEPSLDLENIQTLLSDTFGLPATELEENTVLFSSGLLDSFHLVELIPVLEKASGRRIKPGEINLENLDTLPREYLKEPRNALRIRLAGHHYVSLRHGRIRLNCRIVELNKIAQISLAILSRHR